MRLALCGFVVSLGCLGCAEGQPEAYPNRPRVPGVFAVSLRERDETGSRERQEQWQAAETAIIICDMWDNHYCQAAAQRVGVMVPRMNTTLTAARDHGAQIVHSPSGTIDLYADTYQRKRLLRMPAHKPPFPLEGWCHRDPDREPELPVDTSRSACEDPNPGAVVRKYTRQHPGLDILGYDVISDRGDEIFNLMKHEGIKNVAIMGVHTNMCVLGRPFGIRQLVRLGFNVALVRDLTDTMYDPREKPFVSHTRGTELVIEHIERYWCPSLVSTDLMQVVPGSAGPMRP